MNGAIDWQSLRYLPLVAAAGVACLVATVALYRRQLRDAGRGWRWVVPGFRVLAIVALLASVLRPSVRRPAGPEDLGDVVVVVGESAGMSVADRSWTPAERVAVAAALGELPPGAVRWSGRELRAAVERLRPLIDEAARAASEVEYARVAGRSVGEATRRASQRRAALVTASRELAGSAASAPEKVRPAVQWADVASVLDAKGNAAWAELRARVDAAVRAIDAEQVDADAKLYAADARVKAAADGVVGRSRAELARLIVERVLRPAVPVRDQARPGRAVRAAVVLGDGRGGVAVPDRARVVAAGVAPAVVRDVSIRDVAVPAVAYVGDVVPIRVDLRAEEFPGARVTVRASAAGASESREVVVSADGVVSVEVPVRFAEAGVTAVEVAVAALEGEATGENNRVERRVRVLGERTPVLVVEGGTVLRSESAREVVTRVPGVSARVVEEGGEWSVESEDRLVVLDDVSAGSLSVEQLDAINELVLDRGGTLVLMAGRMNWPLDAESEALLDEYLPYAIGGMGQSWWRSAGGRVAKVEDPAAAVMEPLAVRRYVQFGTLKPGVRVLMSEPESGAPVMTEAAVGRGRVVTVGAEVVGDSAEVSRFWAGLMRRVAERPFAVERDGYALDTDVADVPAGAAAVRVRARVPREPAGAAGPSVLVLDSDGRVVRTETLAVSEGGGRWEGIVSNLSQGEYVIRLDADEGVAALEAPVRVRGARERELVDVTPDQAALRRLAASTGGEVVPITEVDRLPAVVLDDGRDRPAVIEYPLWDSPYLFLFVTACLTTEWALRKRLGLA